MTTSPASDPRARSWVDSANDAGTDFPLQNLPFGVFKRAGSSEPWRVGIAIGDQVFDIVAALTDEMFEGNAAGAAERCREASMNALAELGRTAISGLRDAVADILVADSPLAKRRDELAKRLLVPMSEVEMRLPVQAGDYTDFYASIHHATNVGSMFRPDNPLLPNYKYLPIGYHGRSSSLVVSGTPFHRPRGQIRDDASKPPVYMPSNKLDYELEVGIVVGPGNAMAHPISMADAERHVVGLCLVNDWSARAIQSWEYQPLGPFLAKNFATTVSPWVVTLDALEPFRAPAFPRAAGDPAPLPHLSDPENEARGGIAITLEVWISTAAMRERGDAPVRLSRGSFTDMYWTVAQLITHHTSNGCNLRPGDLLASGTVSGATKESRGCLLELTWRGAEPIDLPNGERRTFLQDGDEVILRGYCERQGHPRVGFGDCRGTVLPSLGAE